MDIPEYEDETNYYRKQRDNRVGKYKVVAFGVGIGDDGSEEGDCDDWANYPRYNLKVRE